MEVDEEEEDVDLEAMMRKYREKEELVCGSSFLCARVGESRPCLAGS